MTRFRLSLEYDGTPFVGWQRQDNGPSVQAALEDAVFAFSGERITVHGAGRTDAGVHALGQVAHFDIIRETPADTVRDALNFYLRPHPIAVLEVEVAVGDFHSRFSATEPPLEPRPSRGRGRASRRSKHWSQRTREGMNRHDFCLGPSA